MGTRNETHELDEKAILEAKNTWQQKGKVWEINPPLASHFGGVWERKIGQMRRAIEGEMLSNDNKILDREQFATMIQHAACIVNSTPLWDPPESPTDPQPISPQRLLTQRDDTCTDKDFRPQHYSN